MLIIQAFYLISYNSLFYVVQTGLEPVKSTISNEQLKFLPAVVRDDYDLALPERRRESPKKVKANTQRPSQQFSQEPTQQSSQQSSQEPTQQSSQQSSQESTQQSSQEPTQQSSQDSVKKK